MAEREPESPDQVLSDDITEGYATNFSVAVSPQEVMIFFGKLDTSINKDGSINADQIVYHSKMQMSHEAAGQLRDLLDQNLGERHEARD